jgi:hypothetical protein
MKVMRLLLSTAVIATLVSFNMTSPASAARTWKDWINSGYCPVGECGVLGFWRVSDVKNCRVRTYCRWH